MPNYYRRSVYGARLPRGYEAEQQPWANEIEIYNVGPNGEAYVAGSSVQRTLVGSIERINNEEYAVATANAAGWTIVVELVEAFRWLNLDAV